jgi:hypothetical protein
MRALFQVRVFRLANNQLFLSSKLGLHRNLCVLRMRGLLRHPTIPTKAQQLSPITDRVP